LTALSNAAYPGAETKMNPVSLAFAATTLAGLATGVGSLIALISKKPTARFLSVSLGFSAGVMIFVALGELFRESISRLSLVWGPKGGYWGALGGFFGGMAVIAILDRLVPPAVNPHEARAKEAAEHEAIDSRSCDATELSPYGAKLLRTGFLTAMVITIHNFPEGIATLFATLESPRFGAAIAIAIAIHNIPEGIAISVPVYYSTGSRRRAFWYSFASGLSEPLGALIGYLLLKDRIGGPTFGIILSAVAGIMIYISLDELLPSAREYGKPHLAMAGLFGGMAVMGASLALTL
jgi:zinc transporter, ZIP family